MPAHLPLIVLIGPESDDELVLYEGEIVARVSSFTLLADQILHTHFSCAASCFPRKSGHRPTKALSAYPLRIYANDSVNEMITSYRGRPIGLFSRVHIKLSATEKRIVQFTSYNPLPEELRQALLDLGVELIVQPSLTPTTEETEDAHV